MSVQIYLTEISEKTTKRAAESEAEKRLLDAAFPSGCRCLRDGAGRPYLQDAPDTGISFTHSGKYCALAVCIPGPVGLDLQKISAFRSGLPERFFPSSESRAIAACPDETARRDLFFRLWTIREAYVKYTGRGLSEGMDSFTIDRTNGRILSKKGSPSACYMELEAPEKDYRFSAAVPTSALLRKTPEIQYIPAP
ncbi:MAG: 4'-phosphopantetheinyl transferase superfamily protein [Lachnospiraceae bacterium]|nr:4'-phosphopantetheinyl transferase superfamily protein [Lachnospiraceae bacterium]